MLVDQHQCIHDPQNLGKVASGAGRVGEGQADFFVGIDDKHRTHGQGVAGLGVDHAVEFSDPGLGVADEREVGGVSLRLQDVLVPFVVVLHGVHAEADQLDLAPLKLALDAGGGPQFGGTHGGKVLGVGEQHRPAVAQPAVEVHFTCGGLCSKIRGGVAQA